MESKSKLRVRTKAKASESNEKELLEPMSPTTEFFMTEGVTLFILCFFHLEIIVDFPSIYSFLKNVFLNVHPRFSSIAVEDQKGKKRWKRVDVNIKDHVKVPIFDEGLSKEEYSKHFDDYISKISTSKIAQDKPLWELHIFNYPTNINNNNSSSAATFIFKFHHAIADGTSLMGIVFSCFQRADDSSIPLTFPSSSSSKTINSNDKQNHAVKNVIKVFNIVPKFMVSMFHSFNDFGQSLRLFYSEDDRSPIRSGNNEVSPDYRISTVTLSLVDVKRIKTILGVVRPLF
ncbi:O-acyltransferase WSD1 [Bienertia sinuspersici]